MLQDKKALEDRLKEVQNILETVQNQRNELRQQYKEEKTARESLESQLAAARQQGDADLAAVKENAQQTIWALQSQNQAADTALQEAQGAAQTNLDNANAVKARLQSELITAQQKMASLQKERSEVESKATAVREDLMNRLNNALKQRDAAREEALLSKEELKKLQEDVESGALVPRAAVVAAEAAAAASAATAAASTAAPAAPAAAAPQAQDPGELNLKFFKLMSFEVKSGPCVVGNPPPAQTSWHLITSVGTVLGVPNMACKQTSLHGMLQLERLCLLATCRIS